MQDYLLILIICHLVGDFLLQDDFMATGKRKSNLICFYHVWAYAVPFLFPVALGFPPVALLVILVQHYLQDRFALHLKWMSFWKQTPETRWKEGPMIVDQVMHITFIAIVCEGIYIADLINKVKIYL